jgi:hypothetical protein
VKDGQKCKEEEEEEYRFHAEIVTDMNASQIVLLQNLPRQYRPHIYQNRPHQLM